MNGAGYKGSYVIELYSLGYDIEKELALSKEYLERF
jgi:hypothetical protein